MLFRLQRSERIDACRAPRGKVGGDGDDEDQQTDDLKVDDGVASRDGAETAKRRARECRAQRTIGGDAGHESRDDSNTREREPVTQHRVTGKDGSITPAPTGAVR